MLLPRSRVAAWHGVKDAHQPLQQAARRGEACGVIYSFKIQLTSVEITETLQSVRQRCFALRQRCFRVGARFGAPAVHCTQANALARLIYHAQPRDCPQQGVRGRGAAGRARGARLGAVACTRRSTHKTARKHKPAHERALGAGGAPTQAQVNPRGQELARFRGRVPGCFSARTACPPLRAPAPGGPRRTSPCHGTRPHSSPGAPGPSLV